MALNLFPQSLVIAPSRCPVAQPRQHPPQQFHTKSPRRHRLKAPVLVSHRKHPTLSLGKQQVAFPHAPARLYPNSRPRISFDPHRTKNPGIFPQLTLIEKTTTKMEGKTIWLLIVCAAEQRLPEGRSLHRLWHSAPRNAEARSRSGRRDGRPTTPPPASQAPVFPRAQKRNAPA